MEAENEQMEIEAKAVSIYGGKYVQYNILGNLFEVSAKYVPPIQPVGRGAYGIVWSVSSSTFFASLYLLNISTFISFNFQLTLFGIGLVLVG